jgi:hypothetical protein
MKSIALLLAPVLLVSGAAYAQADRQAATQHERSGTHQPAAGEKQCCCAEMMRKKMMMEMMQQHQVGAAKPGQQLAPGEAEKPHQEHKQ